MNSTLHTRTLQPPGTSTWNITTRFLLLPRKSITPKRQRSASRTPTPPRPRISRPITTQHKTIQPAVATTVRDRVLAGAGIVAVNQAGGVAAGGAWGVAGGAPPGGGPRGGPAGRNTSPPMNPSPTAAESPRTMNT